MPPKGAKRGPRKVCGGRSPRFESRRAKGRSASRRNAAEWSDAMAQVVLKAVHEGSAERGLHLKDYVIWLLQTPGELNTFVGGLKASQAGRELAATILATHAARMAKVDTLDLQRRKARAVLKPLWDRRSGTKGMTPLVLPRAQGGNSE